MIIVPINLPPLLTSSGAIERVSTFKLLGINLDTNLSWSAHINSITSKASKRFYFLKQLKRAGFPYKQLLHFYTAVIRPVLEYAAPAWHHLINRTQAQHLESVQKRAIRTIFNFTRGMPYPNVLFVAQLESLETRRNNLSRSFFKISANQPPVFIICSTSPKYLCYHYRLKLTISLPRPNLRTKKYCSFMHFGLHHYKPRETNIVTPNPLYTSLPAPMYIYAHYLFRILFLSVISTAYHLLSGSRAAMLLLN